MLLEETLVVRDTVLAEHESVVTTRNCQPNCLSRRSPSIHPIPPAFIASSVDRQESPVTSRPFHQHPELCAGVESQEVSRGDVPSHTGGGAKHFCGSRMLKSRGSGSAKVGNGRGTESRRRRGRWIRRELQLAGHVTSHSSAFRLIDY